jgi:hypothetical protein
MDIDSMVKLFQTRITEYTNITNVLIEEFEVIRIGALEYLKRNNMMKIATGNLIWREVEYTPNDGMVVLSGEIKYDIGTTLQSDTGENMVVTEDTQQYFYHPLYIKIPITLVGEPKENIIAFFETLAAQKQKELENQQVNQYNEEFDISTLTDEQKQSLNLHLLSQGDIGESNS